MSACRWGSRKAKRPWSGVLLPRRLASFVDLGAGDTNLEIQSAWSGRDEETPFFSSVCLTSVALESVLEPFVSPAVYPLGIGMLTGKNHTKRTTTTAEQKD